MCGLYGVYQASGIDSAGLEIFNRLGKLSESRGRDSTGIISVERATIKKNKEFITRYRKGLTRASVFHESPEARSLIDGKPVVLAGHTRMATHGKVNIANAHPFEIGHLVGMHNGVYASLYDRENDKTDSRVIFEMLNTLGVPKGLRTINEDHHGYMALAFINKSSDTLNLFSNGGRSLFLGKTKDLWCWASEERFLRACASKWYYIGEIPEDSLVACKIGIEKWRVTQYDYTPRLSSFRSCKKEESFDNIPFKSDVKDSCLLPLTYEQGGHIDTPVKPATPSVVGSTSLQVRFRTTPGVYLTREALKELVSQHGCSCCLTKNTSVLREPLYFFSPSRYICKDCRETDSLIETFFNDDELHLGVWVLPSGKELSLVPTAT